MSKFIGILLVSTVLVSCANTNKGEPSNTKTIIGSILGAGVGAFGGSKLGKGRGRIIATAGGALIGGFIGNRIGATFDDLDNLKAKVNAQKALETNKDFQTSTWKNPNTGNSGAITPIATKGYCREYITTITVGGQEQKAWGKACRDVYGDWKVISSNVK